MAKAIPAVAAPPIPTRQQWDDWCSKYPDAALTNQLCVEDIADWQEAAAQLSKAKASEMLLRTRIFKFYFPSPVEGTNKVQLPDGTLITATHNINRSMDEATFLILRTAGPDGKSELERAGIPADKIVKFKPSLVEAEYKVLNEEQRKVIEQAMEIKPGAPTLKLKLPGGKDDE